MISISCSNKKNKCGRSAADGFETCCRTCGWTDGKKHGPMCEMRSRFTRHEGFISKGGDLSTEEMTIQEAMEKASEMPECQGFCFSGADKVGKQKVYFKSKWDGPKSKRNGTSYRNDGGASPPAAPEAWTVPPNKRCRLSHTPHIHKCLLTTPRSRVVVVSKDKDFDGLSVGQEGAVSKVVDKKGEEDDGIEVKWDKKEKTTFFHKKKLPGPLDGGLRVDWFPGEMSNQDWVKKFLSALQAMLPFLDGETKRGGKWIKKADGLHESWYDPYYINKHIRSNAKHFAHALQMPRKRLDDMCSFFQNVRNSDAHFDISTGRIGGLAVWNNETLRDLYRDLHQLLQHACNATIEKTETGPLLAGLGSLRANACLWEERTELYQKRIKEMRKKISNGTLSVIVPRQKNPTEPVLPTELHFADLTKPEQKALGC